MVHKLKGYSEYQENTIVDEVFESYMNGNIDEFKSWLKKADKVLIVKMVLKFKENHLSPQEIIDYLE